VRRDIIALGPPLIIGDDEVEQIAATLHAAIDEAIERVEREEAAGGGG
jgi:adenosylmethionine-8-amino-7-oxononanoate aminotransferase